MPAELLARLASAQLMIRNRYGKQRRLLAPCLVRLAIDGSFILFATILFTSFWHLKGLDEWRADAVVRSAAIGAFRGGTKCREARVDKKGQGGLHAEVVQGSRADPKEAQSRVRFSGPDDGILLRRDLQHRPEPDVGFDCLHHLRRHRLDFGSGRLCYAASHRQAPGRHGSAH